MKTMLWVAPLLLAACWSANTKELEQKVDRLSIELANSRAEIEQLQRKVAALKAPDTDGSGRTQQLEAKIDDLQRKLDKTQAMLGQAPSPPPSRPSRPQPDPVRTYSLALGKAHVDGPADAKVTMVIADEYACPYCEKVRPTLAELRKQYGKDLRIAYRQFVVHPQTATAPALAICAAIKQKKHDKLDALLWDAYRARTFDVRVDLPDGTSQNCWEHVDGCPLVLGFAKQAGLNVSRFKTDMAGACVTELADSTKELQALGVGATPSFFINGRFMSGAQPAANFAAVIDEEIKKADERIKAGTKRARYYQEWVVDKGDKSLTP